MDIETSPGSYSETSDAPVRSYTLARLRQGAFRYVDDPICIASMGIYVLNRFVLKPHHVGGWLVHDYLNDLLCLPIFVPIILRLQSALGIRRHDLPPTFFEVLHNWVVFSVLYYFVFPRLSAFSSAADPWNSVAYIVGGITSYGVWKYLYASGQSL